jgi:hypothetical protein
MRRIKYSKVKKSKKGIKKWISIDTFKFGFWLIIDGDEERVKKFVNYKIQDGEPVKTLSGFSGAVFYTDNDSSFCILWLKQKPSGTITVSYCAHEAYHLVCRIMEHIVEKEPGEEVFANVLEEVIYKILSQSVK